MFSEQLLCAKIPGTFISSAHARPHMPVLTLTHGSLFSLHPPSYFLSILFWKQTGKHACGAEWIPSTTLVLRGSQVPGVVGRGQLLLSVQ